MSTPARKLATYDDLLALGEDVRAEIIGGVILVHGEPLGSTPQAAPAPLPRHAKPQGVLRRSIGGPFDDDDGHGGPGGWWIFLEVDVALGGGDVVRPDLSGWRRDRLPEPDVRPITTRPDWVCEVLSPSTVRLDRVVKRRLYAEAGIPFYWMVDPEARTLEALELHDGRWLDLGSWADGESARIAPFVEIQLDVGRLFLPAADTPR